jgi:hypothetical protein
LDQKVGWTRKNRKNMGKTKENHEISWNYHKVYHGNYIQSGWWYTYPYENQEKSENHGKIMKYLVGGFEPYPSEKWWTSSVGMMTFPYIMGSHKSHVPNHQPEYSRNVEDWWKMNKHVSPHSLLPWCLVPSKMSSNNFCRPARTPIRPRFFSPQDCEGIPEHWRRPFVGLDRSLSRTWSMRFWLTLWLFHVTIENGP